MNYSKGEWKVSVWQDRIVVASDGQHTIEVANCRNPSLLPSEEVANAHLIAAAPELLAAAEIGLDLVVWGVLYEHPDDEVAQAQRSIIEKALAKAEGREV